MTVAMSLEIYGRKILDNLRKRHTETFVFTRGAQRRVERVGLSRKHGNHSV